MSMIQDRPFVEKSARLPISISIQKRRGMALWAEGVKETAISNKIPPSRERSAMDTAKTGIQKKRRGICWKRKAGAMPAMQARQTADASRAKSICKGSFRFSEDIFCTISLGVPKERQRSSSVLPSCNPSSKNPLKSSKVSRISLRLKRQAMLCFSCIKKSFFVFMCISFNLLWQMHLCG